ncbi:MAG: cytochrome c biogenesis protein CcdA [Candidatus Levybacteria bacterium]|nr:cytochrome c biogenesis protein CcdA [Candidatus Levybacteria bacterium]
MESLIGASLIASFLAGVAALLAPCCITVLLPTYFASIFKQKATIFLMTFVYFLGLLTVFMPIGLGASFFSQVFREYHDTVFLFGGIFLILLGLTLVLGKQFSIPVKVHPKLRNSGLMSVFVLGLFSGIATTCCAPVLAGVLTLSILPGSVFIGGVYTLTYVLGMVIPLFIIALMLDKANLTQRFFAFRKTINYSFFGQKISTTISNLFSGVMFLILGFVILYLSWTNRLFSHSSYQVDINIYLAKLTKIIAGLTKPIPELVWVFLFIGLFLLILKFGISQILNLLRREGRKN